MIVCFSLPPSRPPSLPPPPLFSGGTTSLPFLLFPLLQPLPLPPPRSGSPPPLPPPPPPPPLLPPPLPRFLPHRLPRAFRRPPLHLQQGERTHLYHQRLHPGAAPSLP